MQTFFVLYKCFDKHNINKSKNMKKSGGKNTKFVPIASSDIAQEKVLLPGRRPCTCEASKHKLIFNCTNCGRIVCEQEGSGPCFTCGQLVCTPSEKEIIQKESKQSFKLFNKLMSSDANNGSVPGMNDPKLRSALEHRNKLLDFDQTVEKRTKVIDDENDYFQVDSQWLSAKVRQTLQKKKDEMYDLMYNRQKTTFTLDFAGRKVIDEKPQTQMKFDEEELLKSDTSIFNCQDFEPLDIPLDFQPVFKEVKTQCPTSSNIEENKRHQIRIQDKEIQEMSDDGMCLSMHQPHASLLIAGIKIHEGRVWYTSYRGRMWIHAAGKVPLKQEINHMEQFYRTIREDCQFPAKYPTGCLLGCVDIVECLPQEEYRSQFPDGENASPYVLICENPRELKMKIPMKGKHKIFKLESNIHQAARKMLCRQID